MMDEDGRDPLSPMQDNVLAGREPPPAISVELPAAFKGENIEADSSLAPSRAGSAVPTEESRSPLTRLPENSSSGNGGGRPPSAELFYKGEALDAELEEETTTEGGSRSESPPCAPPCLEEMEAEPLEDAEAPEAEEVTDAAALEVSEDKDAENAIFALLALQREPSPQADFDSRGSSPEPQRRRPLSPNLVKQSAIQKGSAAEASRYFCKFPRCGKAYASTDAVRKHCRQRHLDWLRRLGHGCPALYCRWED